MWCNKQARFDIRVKSNVQILNRFRSLAPPNGCPLVDANKVTNNTMLQFRIVGFMQI